MPVYQVERYLRDCLDSLLAQTFGDFEAVLVDDGSTDGSVAVASEFTARDPRLRIVHQPNAGPGAARNAGVAQARGTYLAFLDSDDSLPPTAYACMVDALTESGSDFVVGAVAKQARGRYRVAPWMRQLHRQRRSAVTIDDAPEMVVDIFAWNKMFRRSFWESHRLRFPEGVRYEDHALMTRAYLEADRFDVVPDVVYRWRVRDDGSSITQQKHQLDNLRDGFVAKRAVTRLVLDRGSARLRWHWFTTAFDDLPPYYREVPGCGDTYWECLRAGVRELLDVVPAEAFAEVRTHVRLLSWLVAHNRRDEMLEVLRYVDEHRGRFPVVVAGSTEYVALPFLDDPDAGIPPEMYRVAAADTPPGGRRLGGGAGSPR